MKKAQLLATIFLCLFGLELWSLDDSYTYNTVGHCMVLESNENRIPLSNKFAYLKTITREGFYIKPILLIEFYDEQNTKIKIPKVYPQISLQGAQKNNEVLKIKQTNGNFKAKLIYDENLHQLYYEHKKFKMCKSSNNCETVIKEFSVILTQCQIDFTFLNYVSVSYSEPFQLY